jgi:hypothetical protein
MLSLWKCVTYVVSDAGVQAEFIYEDVQIAAHYLFDHIDWDLLSPLTPGVCSVHRARRARRNSTT